MKFITSWFILGVFFLIISEQHQGKCDVKVMNTGGSFAKIVTGQLSCNVENIVNKESVQICLREDAAKNKSSTSSSGDYDEEVQQKQQIDSDISKQDEKYESEAEEKHSTEDPIYEEKINSNEYSYESSFPNSLMLYLGGRFREDAIELGKTAKPLINMIQSVVNEISYKIYDAASEQNKEDAKIWLKNLGCRIQINSKYLYTTTKSWFYNIKSSTAETTDSLLWLQNLGGEMQTKLEATGKSIKHIVSFSKDAATPWFENFVTMSKSAGYKIYTNINNYQNSEKNEFQSWTSYWKSKFFKNDNTPSDSWSKQILSSVQKTSSSIYQNVAGLFYKSPPEPKSWSDKLQEYVKKML